MSVEVMASALHIPAIYAAEMLREDFEQILKTLIDA